MGKKLGMRRRTFPGKGKRAIGWGRRRGERGLVVGRGPQKEGREGVWGPRSTTVRLRLLSLWPPEKNPSNAHMPTMLLPPPKRQNDGVSAAGRPPIPRPSLQARQTGFGVRYV